MNWEGLSNGNVMRIPNGLWNGTFKEMHRIRVREAFVSGNIVLQSIKVCCTTPDLFFIS